MVGLGEPREVRAGVVGGTYFEVMGLRPVLGRLLDTRDDGPNAAGAVVLTYRFWTSALGSDPTVLGKTVRLGTRTRHDRRRPRALRSLPGRNRDHRQHRDQPAPPLGHDGDRPGPPHDRAVRPPGARAPTSRRRAPSCAPCTRRWSRPAPRGLLAESATSASTPCSCAIRSRRAPDGAAGAAGRLGAGVRHRLLERRQPDPRAHRPARRRARYPRGARRRAPGRSAARCSPRACCSAARARSSAS